MIMWGWNSLCIYSFLGFQVILFILFLLEVQIVSQCFDDSRIMFGKIAQLWAQVQLRYVKLCIILPK